MRTHYNELAVQVTHKFIYTDSINNLEDTIMENTQSEQKKRKKKINDRLKDL